MASPASANPNYRRVAGSEVDTTCNINHPHGDESSTSAINTAAASGVSLPSPPLASSSSSSSTTTNNRTMQERLMDKAIAAAWVMTAAFVAYWTDTRHVLFSPETQAVRLLLQMVAVGVGVQTVLTLYLTVYLPYGKGLTDSSAWSVYCPRVIPVLTAVSVMTVLLLVRAVWPVWGFLAPLILSIQGLGVLFFLQFVPSW